MDPGAAIELERSAQIQDNFWKQLLRLVNGLDIRSEEKGSNRVTFGSLS